MYHVMNFAYFKSELESDGSSYSHFNGEHESGVAITFVQRTFDLQ